MKLGVRVFGRCLAVALALLAVGRTGAVEAAPKAISPAEALRMGLDRFIEAYTDRTGDHSEAGYDDACTTYGRYRAAANDARVRRLPAGRGDLARSARKALARWDDAFHELRYLACGGGTMYTHEGIRAVGPREDQLAALIRTLASAPTGDPAARSASAVLMKRIDTYVARTAKVPSAVDEMGGIAPDMKTRYPEVHRSLRQATEGLRRTARALPDRAAREFLARPAGKTQAAE